MNQSESISSPIGDGAAVINECSNTRQYKLPHLTILMPFRFGGSDQRDEPAASILLGSDATKQLYEFLKSYYETP